MRTILLVLALLVPSGPAPAPTGKAENTPEAYAWGMSDVDLNLVQRQTALLPVAERLQALEKLPGFTGVAFEGDALVLRWAGPLPGEAQAAVAEARTHTAVRTATARFARTALVAAAATLRAQVEAGRGGGIHTIRVNGDGTGLTVSADSLTPAVRDLAAGAGVDTVLKQEPWSRTYSRQNDFAPWAGGAQIVDREAGSPYNGRGCTSGFGVRSGGGFTYLLTASHCGTGTDMFRDPTGETVGRVAARDHDKDVMLVRTSASGDIYVGGPPGQAQSVKGVAGWAVPFQGQGICQSGAATGNLCGLVIEDVDDIRCAVDPEGSPYKCWEVVRARRTNGGLAGRAGDSGGPVYAPNGTRVTALGVVTGGDGGAVLWFGTFRAANVEWGVTALTRSF